MKCSKCGENKDEKFFGKAQLAKVYGNPTCKKCDREKAKARIAERLNDPYLECYKFIG